MLFSQNQFGLIRAILDAGQRPSTLAFQSTVRGSEERDPKCRYTCRIALGDLPEHLGCWES